MSHKTNNIHLNSVTVFKQLNKEGVKAFYRGYFPALFIYMAFSYKPLKTAIEESYSLIKSE